MIWLAPLVAAGLLLLQWGLGRRLLERWPLSGETRLERHLLEIAAGFLATGALLFMLATFQLYRSEILRGLYGLGLLAILVLDGKRLLALLAGAVLSLSDEEWTPFERACLPVIVLFLGLTAFYALAPTTTWDPLNYHYQLPRLWLNHGGFYPITALIYAHFPATTELHFGWLMAITDDLAANQYTILTIVGMVLATAMVGLRWCSRPAVVGGLTLLLGLPLIYTEQAQGGVIDCALTFFLLLALWAMLRWLETRTLRYLGAAAVLLGGSIAIKHSGWMLGFFFFGLILLDAWRNRELTKLGIPRMIGVGGIAFLIALPWYLKSFAMTGNPVWPFADSLFNGTPKHYADILYWSNPNFRREVTDLVTWWWAVTTDVPLTQYRFRLITPAYLGLLPLVGALFTRSGPHLTLLAYCAFLISVLLFQAPGEPRYMLPAWALLGVLLVYGAECAGWLAWRRGSVLLAILVLVPMVPTLALLQIESRDRLPFILGQDTRAESYARRVETWPAIDYIQTNLAANEQALHGDPRVLPFTDTSAIHIIYPLNYPDVPSWDASAIRLLKEWHTRRVRFVSLSVGAHYMGLTRAALLEAQKGMSLGASGELGIRSAFDDEPPTMFRRLGSDWQAVGPLPEAPTGPLKSRTFELGAFTSREITRLSNPRVVTPPLDEPNYIVNVRGLQERWEEPDVLIVRRLQELIDAGYLQLVLDHPPCPVWEVNYPAQWGPPGTDLRVSGGTN